MILRRNIHRLPHTTSGHKRLEWCFLFAVPVDSVKTWRAVTITASPAKRKEDINMQSLTDKMLLFLWSLEWLNEIGVKPERQCVRIVERSWQWRKGRMTLLHRLNLESFAGFHPPEKPLLVVLSFFLCNFKWSILIPVASNSLAKRKPVFRWAFARAWVSCYLLEKSNP